MKRKIILISSRFPGNEDKLTRAIKSKIQVCKEINLKDFLIVEYLKETNAKPIEEFKRDLMKTEGEDCLAVAAYIYIMRHSSQIYLVRGLSKNTEINVFASNFGVENCYFVCDSTKNDVQKDLFHPRVPTCKFRLKSFNPIQQELFLNKLGLNIKKQLQAEVANV